MDSVTISVLFSRLLKGNNLSFTPPVILFAKKPLQWPNLGDPTHFANSQSRAKFAEFGMPTYISALITTAQYIPVLLGPFLLNKSCAMESRKSKAISTNKQIQVSILYGLVQ